MSRIDVTVAVNTSAQVDEIKREHPEVEVVNIGENIGICKPIYEITKNLKGNDNDIVIAFFDDVFCISEWDEYLYEQFEDFSGAVMINDGVQHPDPKNAPLLVAVTMPVMDMATLKRLNRIIFNPTYAHYYADNELYSNLEEMGLLKDNRVHDKTTFLHKHFNKVDEVRSDEHDQRVVDKCAIPDREIYKIRKKYPLEERLKLKSDYRDGDKMKILIVCDRLEIRGGLETHVATLAKAWAKKDDVLVYANAISKKYQLDLASCSLLNGYSDKHDDYIIDNYKPDIIIGHPFSGIDLATKLLAKLDNAKMYSVMHGDYTTGLSKEAISNTKKVICVSHTAYIANRKIVPEDKLKIIYNGVNIKDFYPTKKHMVLNKNLGFNNRFKTIVAITRLQDGKEIPVKQLLQILTPLANRLAGLNVAIVGGGSQLDLIKELAEQVPKSPNLNLQITGEKNNVRSYMNLADIVLGCDRVAIESILCNKNVFYMGLGQWKGLIKNDNYNDLIFTKNGFEDYTNDELVRHLTWMLMHKKEIDKYTNKLMEIITNICDNKIVAQKYIDTFNEELIHGQKD